MNSRIVTPPQRISREACVAPVCFFITYGVERAARARRHSVTAAYTCTTSETTSADPDHPEQAGVREHRLAERAQVLGVLVEGVVAGEGLRLPYMCSSTKRMKIPPLTAIRIFSAIVVRTAAGALDQGSSCCAGLATAGATLVTLAATAPFEPA